jgi:phosphodiesterase/alkaline phosphatase D-like protein
MSTPPSAVANVPLGEGLMSNTATTRSDRSGLTRRRFIQAAAVGAGALVLNPVLRPDRAMAAGPQPVSGASSLVEVGAANQLEVCCHTDSAALARAWYWPTANSSARRSSAWTATNAANTAKMRIADAGDGRGWSYQFEVATTDGASSVMDTVVRRVPAYPARGQVSAFTFAHGSCRQIGTEAATLQRVADSGAVFFAMLGDMGYWDTKPTGQDYAHYVTEFREFMSFGRIRPLLARMPIFGMQDDHDYGVNDANANTVANMLYTAHAFADVVPGTLYPADSYRHWSVGQADFWLLDNRRYKDPKTGPYQNGQWMSVLRQKQRNWLLAGLAASTARVKVVLAPMTFSWYWSRGEQHLVLDYIKANVKGTVLIGSGDKHAGGFTVWDGRVREMLAAPINNSVKARTPNISNPRCKILYVEQYPLGSAALFNAVGLVDVDPGNGTVTQRLVRDTGQLLHAEVVRIA